VVEVRTFYFGVEILEVEPADAAEVIDALDKVIRTDWNLVEEPSAGGGSIVATFVDQVTGVPDDRVAEATAEEIGDELVARLGRRYQVEVEAGRYPEW
jgi:chemotaxis signal transduction protein